MDHGCPKEKKKRKEQKDTTGASVDHKSSLRNGHMPPFEVGKED
jgi:hypothetical protein